VEFTQLTPDHILECSGKRVAIDTETNGLRWYSNHIIGVGLHCPDEGITGYIPTLDGHTRQEVYKNMNKLSRETSVVMHNAKFDFHFLNVAPRNFDFIADTTVLVHLIDSRNKKSLGTAESIFLGSRSKREYVESAPPRKKIWEWPLDLCAKYCINDTVVTYQLATELAPRVRALGLWEVFLKDMEYLKDLWDIERRGVLVDQEYLHKAIKAQSITLAKLEETLYDSCGYEFNWRSPQQLSTAIYDNLGIAKPKNPFAGADGVDRSRFADAGLYKSTCTSTFLLTEKIKHPLGTLIFAIRESARLRKTMDKYLELLDSDGLVHTNFNLTGTRTGRLSSKEPNLQNVPAQARGRFTQSVFTGDTHRTAEYNLRNAFIARPGHVFLSIDWKQMEMRMFGLLSKDPFMLEALAGGRDIHGEIAEKVWGTRDDVHREWSKTISFGLIYGMTIGSLMFKLNMTKNEAAKVCDQYWAEFPRIKPWLDEVVEECKHNGFIRYWDGRIWKEDNPIDMYKGANAQIQGGCAEILSIAEIRVSEWCRTNGTTHGVVNLVHDEIITEVPEDDIERATAEISQIMRIEDIFGLPFITDAKFGHTYGSLHDPDKEEVLEDMDFLDAEEAE
jgi:DNA polymerase I